MSDQILEAFDLIRRYAEREGWIPVGFRSFVVGPWTVTVNGTPEQRDDLPPYHARIEHADIIAIMVIHPYGGSVGGWKDAEAEFIAAMQEELGSVTSTGDHQ